MPLSEAGIVRYMLDHGLLRRSDVVDGNFVAIPSSRQNQNVLVHTGEAGATWFVKQARSSNPLGSSGIAREATFYWLVSTQDPFHALAGLIPAYHFYDTARGVLVLEGSKGVAPHRRQSLQAGFPAPIGEAVGRALADVHRVKRADAGMTATLIASEPPWPLSILQPEVQAGLPQNPGTKFALGIVARHSGFERALSKLRSTWSFESLIHSDMKWDNCLIEAHESAAPAVRIIDWEMAAWGDPAWDAGSLIQDYVSQGIMASPLPVQAAPEAVAEAVDAAMAAIRPAIAAFWSAYSPDPNPDFLRRSISCGGARILQTCIEALAVSGAVTTNIAALLQLSHDMLERPDAAATSFLGFR